MAPDVDIIRHGLRGLLSRIEDAICLKCASHLAMLITKSVTTALYAVSKELKCALSGGCSLLNGNGRGGAGGALRQEIGCDPRGQRDGGTGAGNDCW